MRHIASLVIAGLLGFAPIGCQSPSGGDVAARPSNLTPGMAKKTITNGRTSQAEVTEVFGPPDLVTHRDGIQIWTYDKIRYDVQASSGYFNVLIAGTGSSRTTSSSTSTMLIVYFDANDIVTDYRLSTIRF
mgnify:CR=1 FL=1